MKKGKTNTNPAALQPQERAEKIKHISGVMSAYYEAQKAARKTLEALESSLPQVEAMEDSPEKYKVLADLRSAQCRVDTLQSQLPAMAIVEEHFMAEKAEIEKYRASKQGNTPVAAKAAREKANPAWDSTPKSKAEYEEQRKADLRHTG